MTMTPTPCITPGCDSRIIPVTGMVRRDGTARITEITGYVCIVCGARIETAPQKPGDLQARIDAALNHGGRP